MKKKRKKNKINLTVQSPNRFVLTKKSPEALGKKKYKQLNLSKMQTKKRETKNYALIYFRDKKPLKKPYDTASEAFYDYEYKGCVLVELFNEMGNLLASRRPITK